MENKNIDTELKSLFKNHKQVIEDNGFAENVLQNLPHKRKFSEWLVVPFAIIGGIVAFILTLNSELLLKITQIVENKPERVFFTLPITLLVTIIVLIVLERERSIRYPFD